MSIIQNYVGLDGKIEAIVRSVMGDVDVDLTDYYTKEEVDALIASGGGGTQIDYNDLLNRPIINGLIQSNLDMKNYLLLKNGTTVYLPTLNSVDDVVTFDKKVRAPNLVTAENITPLLQDVEDEIYTNVYTISQMNEKLQLKADAANVYDKDYINTEFINVRNEMSYKADSNNVYPKTETYNRTEIDDMISGSVIPIDAYTKEETNNLLNFKADKAHTYTKEEISNFGLGTIITTKTDPQSQLQKLSIANHTELQKLYIGEEDSGMSFRFIESEVSYPEVMKILGDERTLKVSQYKLNAQMGITTNELLADNIYTKEEVDNQVKELKNQIQTLTDKVNDLLMTIKDMNTYEEVLFRLIDLTKEIMNVKTTCGNLDARIIALEGSKGDIDAVKQNVVELQTWKTTTDETLTNLDARVTALEGA